MTDLQISASLEFERVLIEVVDDGGEVLRTVDGVAAVVEADAPQAMAIAGLLQQTARRVLTHGREQGEDRALAAALNSLEADLGETLDPAVQQRAKAAYTAARRASVGAGAPPPLLRP
jgi:hypothetical protein